MPLSPLSQLLASPVSMLRDGGDGGVGGGDEVPFLEESPFLQRQLSAEIHNMQSDDARNLANSDLSLCLDENGNSDLSFCLDDNGLPFFEPAPPPTEGEPAPPAPKYDGPFAGCELKITGHQFHKIAGHELLNSDPKMITPTKHSNMDVEVVDENNSLVADETLPLRAVLTFENGATVLKKTEQDEEPLKGQTKALLIHGRASFKMKVGKQFTSTKCDKQRFRVLIEPEDDAVRRACPALTRRSEAFTVIVKTSRPEKKKPPSLAPAPAPVPLGSPPLAAIAASQVEQIRLLTSENGSMEAALAALHRADGEAPQDMVSLLEGLTATVSEAPPPADEASRALRAANALIAALEASQGGGASASHASKRPAADPPATVRDRPQRARRSAA